MTFDKTAYQREYMRRQRAEKPSSQRARMQSALEQILKRLEGNEKPLAAELRAIAKEGLE